MPAPAQLRPAPGKGLDAAVAAGPGAAPADAAGPVSAAWARRRVVYLSNSAWALLRPAGVLGVVARAIAVSFSALAAEHFAPARPHGGVDGQQADGGAGLGGDDVLLDLVVRARRVG